MEVILQERYMNPLSDFAFKKLFFNELNKELLIDFLNEVLPWKDKILDIQYQPTLQLGDWEADRKVIFDIFCTNGKGEFFIIEMQKARHPHFRDRCLFYSTFPIRKQAPQGLWNFKLKAVYTIAIMDFTLFNEFEEDENLYIEHVNLLRDSTKTLFSDKLNYVFIELPKFRKEVAELKTNMDRWLFCLKNLSKLDSRPPEVQGKIFEMLFKAAEIQQLKETEMEKYRKSILEYNDVREVADFAKEEGLLEGLERGHAEGLEEGIEKEKITIARNCLKESLPVETIQKITGLTIEQINALK